MALVVNIQQGFLDHAIDRLLNINTQASFASMTNLLEYPCDFPIQRDIHAA
jgi:hypothetical protein